MNNLELPRWLLGVRALQSITIGRKMKAHYPQKRANNACEDQHGMIDFGRSLRPVRPTATGGGSGSPGLVFRRGLGSIGDALPIAI